MILYTVLPDQAVLSGEDEIEEHAKKQRYIEIGGRQVLIETVSDTECKIIRLISSDPQDYLNSRYQPGNIVSMKPQI
ncbi:MAG TPA: YlzJ-like family protein [Bacillales bacterium]